MPLTAVTFDFHNTLAICDEWFELEVRTLVPRFLDWYEARDGATFSASTREQARQIYRAFRLEIIQHGEECDAVDGVLHVLRQLGLEIDRSLVEQGTEELMRAALPGSRPVTGVVEAVQQFASAGIRLGVVSNAIYHPFLEWSLAKFGIAECFTTVVTSSSAGYYKSRPEVYRHALRELRARPEDALHVGDSYRFDVEGAGRAGMRTVWYRVSDDEGVGDAADLRVTSLVGLAPLLLERFGAS
jgi:putative hydrolase of the HAD superfamily